MKEREKNNLLIFADFLDGLSEPEIEVRTIHSTIFKNGIRSSITCHVLYHIIYSLPFPFTSWFYECVSGDPIHEDYDETFTSVYQFFGLSDDGEEFQHLFCVDSQQPEKFGGRIIKANDKNPAKIVAQNILEFIKRKK